MTETTTSYYDFLPGVLAEIAEAGGLDAALKVAETVGGRRAYFPAEPKEGHWLVDLVGFEKAEAICTQLAPGDRGVELEVPLGPCGSRAKQWRLLREMIDAGAKSPEIVRMLGVTQRTVRRHKNGHSGQPKTDPDQRDLF